MDTLKGTVKSIIYRNAENGYSVIEVTDDNGDERTVVGPLPLITIGERAEFTGDWVEHPAYGPQLKAKGSKTIAPASLSALISYLGSGLIKGVGEATARDIVSTFGMDTLNVLENEPERLREVPGIGRLRANKIAESFAMQKGMREVMLALQEFGITVAQSMKLYNTYGALCIAKLKENPYRLIDDIEGIGFITADKLAVKAGFEPDSPFRIKAGLKYTLQWARQEGHTFLPREKLLSVACQLLHVDTLPAEEMLDELIISGDVLYKLIDNTDAVFLPGMYSAESECARRLMGIASRDGMQLMLGINAQINALEKELKIPLAPQLSPSQNAQKYYKRYNKAKNAEIEAAKQIENAKNDLEYLESTLAAIETSDTESDLNAIRAELIAEGYLNRKFNPKKQKQNASKPMHFVSSDGFDIYVGKNNTQNDYLTLKFANSSDLWFHTKNIHGSHTIIKLGLDKDVPKTTITEAAELAAYYSKGRDSSQVPVDFTQIKNVKKPNGAKPGMVIYDYYNTIYVTPKELKNE